MPIMTDKKKWQLNLDKVFCPKCNEQMPSLRISKDIHQLMWGGWTCPNCGCKMDKFGEEIKIVEDSAK
jgi:transcription elongation factor Elf1